MSEMISSSNVERLAKQCYVNTIFEEAEFWEDYERIKYIKRLFNRFKQTGSIKTNLVMNHLIVLFNVFESQQLTRILFFKFEGYHQILKPFLQLLQRCPDRIEYFTDEVPTLYINEITDNAVIVECLRQTVLCNE